MELATELPTQPTGGISVCASLRVIDVVDIDTVNENFTVTLELLLEWAAPDSESFQGENGLEHGADKRDKDWEPEWFPSWEVAGLCGGLENVRREFWTTKVTERGSLGLLGSTKLGYRVSQSTTFTAKIVEKMDLEEFPFDIEDLTVSIRLACDVGEAHFVRFADEMKFPLVDMRDADVSLSEYFPYPDIPFNFTLKQKSARGDARSTILLQINMVRSQKYYFFNVVSPMLLLTSSEACSWTMDTGGEDGQGSRIVYDLNLILATIAFKFVIVGMLPQVSYMTTLDGYIFACFMFQFMVMFWHALQGAIPSLGTSDIDRLSFLMFMLAWFLVNIRFVFHAVRSIALRRTEIEEQCRSDDVHTGDSLKGLRVKKNRSERLLDWAIGSKED